ncbi:MAG: class I SAM-dependent methyltransferase [Acidobacteriota bacterium]
MPNSLKESVKNGVSPESLVKLRRLRDLARTAGRCSNLTAVASVYGTDKWGTHFYTKHYQRYFSAWRKRNLRILEIGVGGYSAFDSGGASLRMWSRYFPHAQIVGIDLYDKTQISESRITVLQCDQTDTAKLASISERYGPFDIIIDDGSHLNQHVIATFQCLFPLLKSPGFYAIEDLQTAYWPSWGGVPGQSSMDYLKSLVDCLNHAENPAQQSPAYYDQNIVEIAFFHNLCILAKGSNDEPSNCPELVAREREALRKNALSV